MSSIASSCQSKFSEENLVTFITKKYNLGETKISKLLLGCLSPDDITSLEEYKELYKIRHDILHYLVAVDRDLPFNEMQVQEIKELSRCKSSKYWNLVKKQTPDIIICRQNNVIIIEFTISYSKMAEQSKISKYSTLVNMLKDCQFNVELEIIVYTISISQPDMEEFCRFHKITYNTFDMITKYINVITSFIYRIESTPLGQNWYHQRINLLSQPFPELSTHQDIITYLNNMENKPISDQDLKKEFSPHISSDDSSFIDTCIDLYEQNEENDQDSFCDSSSLSDCIDSLKIKINSRNNSMYFRPFLPLPFIESTTPIPNVRSTKRDDELLEELKIKLHNSKDGFLFKIGDMKKSVEKVKLPTAIKYSIGLEGPGRKSFIKHSLEHRKSQDRNTNYLCPLNVWDYEVEQLIREFSIINGGSLENIYGPGLNYVEACQSVFREININVMRNRGSHDFIIKPTGVEGVFVCIWPGPKLRTGENVSTIWFKLIAYKRFIKNQIQFNPSFHQWEPTEEPELIQCRWLSTDANRLDHYLRCFDRVRMAFLAYQHQKELNYIPGDELGTIIAIYMEDRRTTSKMIQDARYLVMISLSIFRQWKDLISKLDIPIRSPLQALLLNRMLNFCLKMSDLNTMKGNFRFGKIVNEGDGLISDKYSGAIINLPRILTNGERVNFQQLLCEMYFCMLFNKNQDDPTHASFQILDKILEGERKYLDNLSDDKHNLVFGGDDSFDSLSNLFKSRKTHQFSKKAIMIGSKLQLKSKYNRAQSGLAYKICVNSPILNKSLDEFATFKSSSQFVRDHVDRDLYQVDKKDLIHEPVIEEEFIADVIQEKIPVSDRYSQNPRIRCIEGVMRLITKEDMVDSYDVARKYHNHPLKYQVFKKNQIGGTREILILSIEKRITVNILESVSRVICQQDGREMLTHGSQKFSVMKNLLRDLRRASYKSIIVHHNLDKSRWGPTFIPIQFLYMFEPFKEIDPNLYNYITMTLLVHSQKECILPEKLIRVWMNDVNNVIKHDNKDLQALKEQFLYGDDRHKLSFKNESNMGQGILHYTSSLLHLCAISFRDELYQRLCKRNNIKNTGEWRDLVSSDDSYTAQLVPLDKNGRKRIHLMRKAIRITDILFNMRTSSSKSSNSVFFGEFNSLFCSNLDTFPTLFKFALSSVECVNTDSFFRMTKECYQNSRQIVENGGTLELYLMAQRMNKLFCESLYHTQEGLHNDLNQFNLRKDFIPYQLGIYPVDNENPEFMIMFGPEYHNYNIITEEEKLTPDEKKVFYNSHRLVDKLDPETIAETLTYESYHVGFRRIEAHMGPIKRLQRIRKQVDMSWDEMKQVIYDNPLILLKKPNNKQAVKLRTYLKLFQYGSAEALRTTASSIYYGRMSAAVSANAYHIPSTSMNYFESPGRKGYTYKDCLRSFIEMNISDMKSIPDEIYPYKDEFKTIKKLSNIVQELEIRNPLETRNLKQLELCKFHTMFQNDLLTLLRTFWEDELSLEELPSNVKRDWVNLKRIFPMIKDNMKETLITLNSDNPNKALQEFIVKMMRIMNISSKPMKAFIFGQTTRNIDSTYNVLRGQNKYPHLTTKDLSDSGVSQESINSIYRIYLMYNIWSLMKEQNLEVMELATMFDYKDFNNLIVNKNLTNNIKKRVLMMMMDLNLIDDVKLWTAKTGVILHKWIKRQVVRSNKYTGGFTLASQLGSVILVVDSQDGKELSFTTNNPSNPIILFELLNEILSLLNIDFLSLNKYVKPGYYKVYKDKVLPMNEKNGFHIETTPSINDLTFTTGKVEFSESLITIYDEYDQRIMSTGRGFISTDYRPTKLELKVIPNISVYGVLLHDLIRIGIFSLEFRFNNMGIQDMINVISDFKVDRPEISIKTKKKLSKYFNMNQFKTYKDSKPLIEEAILEESTIPTDEDLIESFLNEDIDLNELIEESGIMINIEDEKNDDMGLLNELLDFNLDDINLLTDLKPIEAKLSSIVLYDRVKFCKYNIICRMFYHPTELSSAAIKYMFDYCNEIGIIYSMVFVYDRIYSESDIDSPPILKPKIHNSINDKFKNIMKTFEKVELL